MRTDRYKYLSKINDPKDLRKLDVSELPTLCAEIRDYIISETAENPGHLGASLGTVELTVAIHYVFDTPNDKLVSADSPKCRRASTMLSARGTPPPLFPLFWGWPSLVNFQATIPAITLL